MKKIPKKKRKVTELYFNEYDGTAEIYTYNTKLKKRLTAYAATYPDLCQLIEDDEIRESKPTIGYYAMFQYNNGFVKSIYWSKKKMLAHADKYSAAFNANDLALLEQGKVAEKDMWKYSSFWYKDFDGMAHKTLLRQLISKWGIMSIEMQKAIEADDAVINESLDPEFVDNEELQEQIFETQTEIEQDLENAENITIIEDDDPFNS